MDQLATLFSDWGLSAFIIAIVAFGGTELIKIPIKKSALKNFGEDGKKKVTKFIVFIPLFLAFLGALIDCWIRAGKWESPFVEGFDWIRVLKLTLAVAGIPSLIFSIVENFQEDHDNAVLKELQEGSNEELEEKRKAELELAKKNAIANANAKALAKAEREQRALEDKQKKLEEARQKQIAKLNKELEVITAKRDSIINPSATNVATNGDDENRFKQLT